MKYDISKNTPPAMPKLGKGTECLQLFALASVARHAPTARAHTFPYPRSAHKWRGIHVSRPKLEGNVRNDGPSCD